MSNSLTDKLTLIKIGGQVIDDEFKLERFLSDFSNIKGSKILVHGGGKIATEIASKLGVNTKMINGRRITDQPMLDVVTMVYGGLLNKKITAKLQQHHCNAIGLSGVDANLIQAKKRPVKEIDYGFAGDLDASSVNINMLKSLLASGLTPIFAALTHDGQGNMLNTNADTIASAIAVALSNFYEVSLVYCFEKKGVLLNVDDEHSLIEEIDYAYYQQLIAKKVIFEGMIPKLDNAFTAIKEGVKAVFIGKADDLNLFQTDSFGTKLMG